MSLHEEVNKFKRWAQSYPLSERSGEWECGYDGWDHLYKETLAFLASPQWPMRTAENVSDLLYAIARDNEAELLAEGLAEEPTKLIALAHDALTSHEPDAKWQLAVQLGTLSSYKNDVEPLLLVLVEDANEYVSRRALLALAALKSERTELLAERAWETGHEYQRIAALWALKAIYSKKLPTYIQKAHEDGREHVVWNAREVQET